MFTFYPVDLLHTPAVPEADQTCSTNFENVPRGYRPVKEFLLYGI